MHSTILYGPFGANNVNLEPSNFPRQFKQILCLVFSRNQPTDSFGRTFSKYYFADVNIVMIFNTFYFFFFFLARPWIIINSSDSNKIHIFCDFIIWNRWYISIIQACSFDFSVNTSFVNRLMIYRVNVDTADHQRQKTRLMDMYRDIKITKCKNPFDGFYILHACTITGQSPPLIIIAHYLYTLNIIGRDSLVAILIWFASVDIFAYCSCNFDKHGFL